MSKHMLEVLARAGVQPHAPSAGPGPLGPPGTSGASRRERARGPLLPKLVFPAVAFVTGALCGYLAGSRGEDEVQAGGDGASAAADELGGQLPSSAGGQAPRGTGAPASTAQPAAAPSAPRQPSAGAPGASQPAAFPADAAFEQSANVWTVLAVTYKNAPDAMVMALDTARWFQSQGLPVVSPRVNGNLIYLCVGAAATSGELTALVGRVREQQSAGGKQEFKSAYQVRISTVIPR